MAKAKAAAIMAGSSVRSMIDGKEHIVQKGGRYSVTLDDGNVYMRDVFDDCFEIIERGPLTRPEAEIDAEGNFVVEGSPIETGSLTGLEVLGTALGVVYLKAKAKKSKNLYDIFAYNLVRDAFEHLAADCGEIIPVYNGNGVFAVKTHTETPFKFEENGTIVEKTGVSEDLMVFDPYGRRLIAETAYNTTFGEVQHAETYGDDEVIIFKTNTRLKEVETKDGYFVVPEPLDGDRWIEVVVKTDDETDERIRYEAHMFEASAPAGSALLQVQNDKMHSMLIVSDDTVIDSNNGYHYRVIKGEKAVEIVRSHPYLCKKAYGPYKNTLVFANERYERATITVEVTDDRGYVTTIG